MVGSSGLISNALTAQINSGGGGGGGGDDPQPWNPPDSFLNVPEPGPYDIYILIMRPISGSVFVDMCNPQNSYTGYGALTIDWGDGTVESWNGYPSNPWDYNIGHSYEQETEQTQMLIHITTSEMSCGFRGFTYNYSLIMKIGSNIVLNNNYIQNTHIVDNKSLLRWFKYNGSSKLPRDGFRGCNSLIRLDIPAMVDLTDLTSGSGYFQNCYCLDSFDFSQLKEMNNKMFSQTSIKKAIMPKILSIADSAFAGCGALIEVSAPLCTSIQFSAFANCNFESVSFPECISVGNYAFQNCARLKKVNLPKCTSIGGDAFYACRALSEITVAQGCVIDSSAFNNCHPLLKIKYV